MSKKSKFDSVFSKKTKDKETPKALKKLIKSKAPTGYTYENPPGSSSEFILRKKNDPSDFSFILRMKFPNVFEGLPVKDIDELLEASFRTQKAIDVDKNLQNGSDGQVPTHISLTGEIGDYKIFPYDFPKLNPITIFYGDKKELIPVKRVPLASFDEIKIESEEASILKILLIINEKTNRMNFTVALNFEILKTIDDYFEKREIIKSFYEGRLKIFSEVLPMEKEKITVFNRNDRFYQALKSLQVVLNKKFEFPKNVSKEEFKLTKFLFESLINKRAVKFLPSSEIYLNFDKEKSNVKDLLPTIEGTDALTFFYPTIETKSFFNISLETIENKLFYNMLYKEFIEERYQLILETTSESVSYVYYQLDLNKEIEDRFPVDIEEAIDITDVDFTVK
ncbi:abortive phage resistance protein AbiGII [Lactococcus petauri]|uniref:abortive phage resistance protein AbiGII n=1 Tax=Lactococcus petauri TaxID=1940789 RepID=UPI0038554335